MGIKTWFNNKVQDKVKAEIELFKESQPSANVVYNHIFPENNFDGEKNAYELGTPVHFQLNYYLLRARAWESYLKTDFVQNAIRKYLLWVVGPGLKLQSDPINDILGLDDKYIKDFTNVTEARFRLYANSKQSTHSTNENLHELADTAMMNAILAGDILCVSRYENGIVNTQLIDGGLIVTPVMGEYLNEAAARGNTIVQGIEINKRGTEVAYYVQSEDYSYTRIPARQKNGTVQAWRLVGLKSKEDDLRGMSLLTAVLETAAKMDRYKDATLTNAEQNANIVGTIKHNALSDGSNPFIDSMAQAVGKGKGTMPDDVNDGEVRAAKIAQATHGQVINLSPGQEYVNHTQNTDSKFEGFFGTNIEIVYATLGIPPEVAMDKFGGAYSGSRAALKSWEYKMFTDRIKKLDRQFYGPVYDFWLNMEVLTSKIQAQGYLTALFSNDFIYLEAYRNKRFIGATVPHIDPLKEVNAERKSLGVTYDRIPLTTAEQSAEKLNTGDYNAIIKKAEYEQEMAKYFTVIADNNSITE